MTNTVPFVQSTGLIAEPEALRAQLQQNSYLFLPKLLDRQVVQQVYDDIMGICQEKGWADSQGKPQGDVIVEGEERFWEVYDLVQKLESFHALAHRPEILAVIKSLVRETPLAHPRNIARIVMPQTDHFTTPAHQDFVHIQGTSETYTCWFPLSDCPQEMGSLIVLAGSHEQNILPVQRMSGAGGLGVRTESLGLQWHGSDFAAGDVLIFHSHTVHKALPNLTGKIRLSVDYRYSGISQPIVPDGLQPHYARLSWDEIYQGWTRPELQYYWRDLDLQLVERDRSYHENAAPA